MQVRNILIYVHTMHAVVLFSPQNLTVLVILYERLKKIANSSVNRSYTIPGGDMNVRIWCVCVVWRV